jgi:hypothetical protein
LGPFISNFFQETKPIFIFQNWTSIKYQKDFSIPQDPHSKLIKTTSHTQIRNNVGCKDKIKKKLVTKIKKNA